MAWVYLFVAGVLEVGWAIGLKYTEGFSKLVPSVLTLAAMVVSILLLASPSASCPSAQATPSGRGLAQSAPRSSALSSLPSRPRLCGSAASR
jgi:quaternary ammonium compound-resistance protein SugE